YSVTLLRMRLRFRLLGAILGAPLAPGINTRGIQCAAHRVVTHTRQIVHTTAANQHDRVLLQVMPLTTNLTGHFVTIGQAHTSYLAQSGVRLLRRRRVHARAHATTLGTGLKRANGVLYGLVFAALADQFIYGSHY